MSFRFPRAFRANRRTPNHRLSSSGPERLEHRTVLSASPAVTGLNLAIIGRDVEFSPAGLPAAMSGDVYLNRPHQAASARPVGTYEEVLTPILIDVNGDTVPDFVGTTGVATFTFFASAAVPQGLASVTTTNVSYIQGVDGAGQLHVGSVGKIAGGTGFAKNVSGEFTSASVVAFYPSFSLDTAVNFKLTGRAAKLFRGVIEVAAGIDQWLGQIRDRQLSDQHTGERPEHGHGRCLSLHDGSHRPGHSQQRVRSVDHVFESGLASILPSRKLTPHGRSAGESATNNPFAAA